VGRQVDVLGWDSGGSHCCEGKKTEAVKILLWRGFLSGQRGGGSMYLFKVELGEVRNLAEGRQV
jgi:hypothetical protein